MARGRLRLAAVPDAERWQGTGERRAGRPARHAAWLLAVALAISGLGWGLARHEASTFSRELEATRGALARAEARLAAAEAQRGQVRARVEALAAEASALAGRLGELQTLVAADLEPARDAQPAGNGGERPD